MSNQLRPKTIAKYRVPIVLMHSRGDPQTMNQLANYTKGEVLATVAEELALNINKALEQVSLV